MVIFRNPCIASSILALLKSQYFVMHQKVQVNTDGEGLYSITDEIQSSLLKGIGENVSGVLHLFVMHTSCALVISEDYDPLAKKDLEAFFQYLAPRNLPFIQHTLEGPDDSPSHMKSALLHQHLACIVEGGQLLLGTWQGIFLAEFRDAPHRRQVLVKFVPDALPGL